MSVRGAWLTLVGGLLVVWLGWLAWQTRHAHSVVLSRSQLAVAERAALADVEAGPDGSPLPQVKNVEPTGLGIGEPRESLKVSNLANARGFRGPGRYLLLLSGPPESPRVTLPPRSPGADADSRPVIYLWDDDDVRVQFQRLTAR